MRVVPTCQLVCEVNNSYVLHADTRRTLKSWWNVRVCASSATTMAWADSAQSSSSTRRLLCGLNLTVISCTWTKMTYKRGWFYIVVFEIVLNFVRNLSFHFDTLFSELICLTWLTLELCLIFYKLSWTHPIDWSLLLCSLQSIGEWFVYVRRRIVDCKLRRSTDTLSTFLQTQNEYVIKRLCGSNFWTHTVLPLLFTIIADNDKPISSLIMQQLLETLVGDEAPVGVTPSRLLLRVESTVSLLIALLVY